MESKAKRGSRQSENSLPNTIVIQLVSAQPQAMPISVHATPLLPGSKSPVEQPRRPAPPAYPNRSKSPMPPYPSRLQPAMCSPLRRRTQTDEFRYSPPPSSIDYTNQSLGQGRTVWMEYVYHPRENVSPPIYSPPPPFPDLKDTGGHYNCNNCCCFRRSLPEPETLVESQHPTSSRPSDSLQWRRESGTPEGRRDQATNTDEQPQHLDCLKAICETLGQAIVTAAMASVEGAQTLSSSSDSSPNNRSVLAHTMAQLLADSKKTVYQEGQTNTPQSIAESKIAGGQDGAANTTDEKLKTEFLSSIQLIGTTPSSSKQKTNFRSPKATSVIYPKTPRGTMASGLEVTQPMDTDDKRMESGVESSPEIYIKNTNFLAGRMPVRKFPIATQPMPTHVSLMGRIGPAVKRRFPTEDLPPPPVKYERTYCPESPSHAMPVIKQTEILEPSTPEQAVVTLPPHPDLCSFSQTDDPCLANKI